MVVRVARAPERPRRHAVRAAVRALVNAEVVVAGRRRIEDHDGTTEGTGGIYRWLKLAEGVGLDPDYVASEKGILPATRFAVDAYVRFVRDEPMLPAVASSLTELFAPKIHKDRIAGLLEHYDFANKETLSYFQHRLSEAPRDVASTIGQPAPDMWGRNITPPAPGADCLTSSTR